MNLDFYFRGYQDVGWNSEPVKCLRNDNGTLLSSPGPSFNWARCDVCGDKYTIELLEDVIKSSWDALRLGYNPLEHRSWGDVTLRVTFGKFGAKTTAWMTQALRWEDQC